MWKAELVGDEVGYVVEISKPNTGFQTKYLPPFHFPQDDYLRYCNAFIGQMFVEYPLCKYQALLKILRP